MSMDIQRILDLKCFDDPTRPAAYRIDRYGFPGGIVVEPGDGKHYEMRIDGDVVLLNVGDFVSGRSRAAYLGPWGLKFLDHTLANMNEHTVHVYMWLVEVAAGLKEPAVPPRWAPRKEGGIG